MRPTEGKMTLIRGDMMINARNTLGTSGLEGLRPVVTGIALAVLAIAVLAVSGSAQQDRFEETAPFQLMGQVVDAESGAILVGAWVGLTGTDMGSLTNDDGRFRIPDMTAGPLVLTVEQLGYETLEWSGNVANTDELLTIELNAQPLLLEGLQVVTDRFRSRRNAAAVSVFAYEPGDLTTTSARTALEFIELSSAAYLTSCNGRYSDQCLQLRGRAVEPVVYIDEMPLLGGLGYLQSFAPWDFHMIEVYGGGRHIRAYTSSYMERAAKTRLTPIPLPFT